MTSQDLTSVANLSQEEIEMIGDLLGSIDLDDDEKGTIEGIGLERVEIIEVASAVAVEPEQVIEIEEVRREIYEAVPVETDTTLEAADASAPSPAPAKAARKKKEPKVVSAPAEPKKPRDLESLEPACFVLTTDVPADLEANKKAVLATRPTQIKIAEKFDNVFTSAAVNRRPSTFIVDCFAVLDAKKEATSNELVAALTLQSYTEGTARSQVGQIMALFPVLKIAERAGSKLTLNPESTLASAYRELLAL